jgi:ribonuclease-3
MKLSQLEDAIGYDFSRRELLEVALTHTSAMSEADREASGASSLHNEKLEFLGDAVLSLVVGHELFVRFPDFREGQLSKLRAHLVSQSHLIRVARRLHLGAFLRLGKGEERNGGREKAALLVDALEAVLGAIYLDGGLEAVRPVVVSEILEPELAAMHIAGGEELPVTDFKSALQEAAQAAGRARVVYELVEQSGPEHSKLFTVEVRLQKDGSDSSESFRASGPAKKRAEQEAARLALRALFPSRWTEYSGSVIDDSGTHSTTSTDTMSLPPVLDEGPAVTIDPASDGSSGNR